MNFRKRKVEWIVFSTLGFLLVAYLAGAVYVLWPKVLLKGEIASWDDIPLSESLIGRLPSEQVRVYVLSGYRQDIYYFSGHAKPEVWKTFAQVDRLWYWQREVDDPQVGLVDEMPFQIDEATSANFGKTGTIRVSGNMADDQSLEMEYDPVSETYIARLHVFADKDYNIWRRAKEAQWRRR